jgi:hypothetical protein
MHRAQWRTEGGGGRGPWPPPLGRRKIVFDGLKKRRKTGGRVDGPPLDCEKRNGGGGIGSVSKKKGRQVVVVAKKGRQMVVSQKGRQLFVAAKNAPPWQFPGYATDRA